MTSLPFGRRIKCGNYIIEKRSKNLTKHELKKLRDDQGIPESVQKVLSRGTMPYITVSTIAGSWKVEFVIGLNMFNALDEVPFMHDGRGHYEVMAGYENSVNMLFNFWACTTTTVGDDTFKNDVFKAMQDYLARATEKNKEPLPEEEADKVLEDEEKKASHVAMLKGIKDYIDKKEAGDVSE